jgi:hypothetical protein
MYTSDFCSKTNVFRGEDAQDLLVYRSRCFWLSSSLTLAQAQTGASLSGVVTDQNGAALHGVAVRIKNVDTGATRASATDGAGRYQESGLPSGRFEIRAAKQGFADETRTGISLAAGQDATPAPAATSSPPPIAR